MKEYSKKIYTFPCEKVVGSEKVVKYRRRYFDISDWAQNTFNKANPEGQFKLKLKE